MTKRLLWVGLFSLATSSAFAQPGESVVVIEGADSDPRVTVLPSELPAPQPEAAPASEDDAPVVLVLLPRSQVRVIEQELAPPQAPPPVVVPPVPTMPYAAPFVRPGLDPRVLALTQQIDELRRRRPSLAFPISALAGGGFAMFWSSFAMSFNSSRCADGSDDACQRQRRWGGLLALSTGAIAFGVVKLIVNLRRRSRIGREIRELQRGVAALQGLPYR